MSSDPHRRRTPLPQPHLTGCTFGALLLVSTVLAAGGASSAAVAGHKKLPAGLRIVGGEWRAAGGAIVGTMRADSSTVAVATIGATPATKCFRISAEITFLKIAGAARWAGFVWNCTSEKPPRWIQFVTRQRATNGAEIALRVPDKSAWQVAARSPLASTLPLGTRHRISITVKGDLATGYVDDLPVVMTCGLPDPEGGLGLAVCGGEVRFEHVEVQPLPEVAPPPAPETHGDVVLRENFDVVAEGQLPHGWKAAGGVWTVHHGELRGIAGPYLSEMTLPVPPLADVAMTADVRFLKARDPSRWFSLMARKPAGRMTPLLQFTNRFDRTLIDGLEIGYLETGAHSWDLFKARAASVLAATNVRHRVRIEVRGVLVKGFLDGRQVIAALIPPDTVLPGEVGFIVSDVTAAFDNVTVEKLAPLTPAEIESVIGGGRSTPLIIAHRGSSLHAPENTIAAFQEAFAAGADAIETDLRLSKDGVIVLCHDDTVDRTTGSKARVAALTVAELQKLDAGAVQGEKYRGARIPTFEEAVQAAQGKGRIFLDLKVPGLGAKIAAIVNRYQMADRVVACCWTDDEVADIRRHLPVTPILYLGSAPDHFDDAYFAIKLRQGVQGFSVYAGSVTSEFIRAAHAHMMPVYVWTLNDPALLALAVHLGVDGILTDDPATLRAVISGMRQRMIGQSP